ncbi:hypothetical protein JOQ06_008537, partial [Pogonophryne albipinna]
MAAVTDSHLINVTQRLIADPRVSDRGRVTDSRAVRTDHSDTSNPSRSVYLSICILSCLFFQVPLFHLERADRLSFLIWAAESQTVGVVWAGRCMEKCVCGLRDTQCLSFISAEEEGEKERK